MNDFESDMNATPLSKLPATVGTRPGSGGGGAGELSPSDVPNYSDLLKDMQNHQRVMPTVREAHVERVDDTTRITHSAPAHYEDMYYSPPPQRHMTPVPMVSAAVPKPPPPQGIVAMVTSIATDKRMYVIAGIVFALLFWIVPRVQPYFPSATNPLNGRLTALGTGVLSAIVGGAYVLVADKI
jgi:hypothetical protein